MCPWRKAVEVKAYAHPKQEKTWVSEDWGSLHPGASELLLCMACERYELSGKVCRKVCLQYCNSPTNFHVNVSLFCSKHCESRYFIQVKLRHLSDIHKPYIGWPELCSDITHNTNCCYVLVTTPICTAAVSLFWLKQLHFLVKVKALYSDSNQCHCIVFVL